MPARGRGVIIEFFGAPGSGKTTLGRALATRLRERGLRVAVVPRDRPSGLTSTFRRTTWPIVGAVQLVRDLLAHPRSARQTVQLLRTLPPKDRYWKVRLGQYLIRLHAAWQRLGMTNDVIVSEQGFVQAVCSLGLLGRSTDASAITMALDTVPISDFLIRLDVPREILEARLLRREWTQSRLEQMFELSLETSIASRAIIEILSDALHKQGRRVMPVTMLNEISIGEAVDLIEREFTKRSVVRTQDAALLDEVAPVAES